jgi:hypothetical protein
MRLSRKYQTDGRDREIQKLLTAEGVEDVPKNAEEQQIPQARKAFGMTSSGGYGIEEQPI